MWMPDQSAATAQKGVQISEHCLQEKKTDLDKVPWLQMLPLALYFFMTPQHCDCCSIDLSVTPVPTHIIRDFLHNDTGFDHAKQRAKGDQLYASSRCLKLTWQNSGLDPVLA